MSDKTNLRKKVIFVFGEGGHQAEMECLINYIDVSRCEMVTFTAMTDVDRTISWADEIILLDEVRDKQSKLKSLFSVFWLIRNFVKSFLFLLTNPVSLVVSTGPGKAIATAIAAKLLRIKVLHVESCSRFTTKSLTGKVMYMLADEFWVQNKSLQSLYPKSTYVGLL
ncbi:PssD/Cps14F family polysaccharide biosynthesis glycosyltransferase [Thalassotalea montiporae]